MQPSEAADAVSPDPYAILQIPADASEARITKAWRRRAKSLRPGTPEFVDVNAAAELLLDADRRAAYDAARAKADEADRPAEAVVADDSASRTVSTAAIVDKRRPRWLSALTGWTGTAVVAGVLAVLAVVLAVWQISASSSDGPAGPYAASAHEQSAALSTAQTAVGVILSYDYRSIEAGVQDANRFMTARQQKEYAATMERIVSGGTDTSSGQKVAPIAERKAVVKASVLSAGVVSATATTAQIGVFLDQTLTEASGTSTHQNWVQVAMVKQGSDWLVDRMCASPTGAACGS